MSCSKGIHRWAIGHMALATTVSALAWSAFANDCPESNGVQSKPLDDGVPAGAPHPQHDAVQAAINHMTDHGVNITLADGTTVVDVFWVKMCLQKMLDEGRIYVGTRPVTGAYTVQDGKRGWDGDKIVLNLSAVTGSQCDLIAYLGHESQNADHDGGLMYTWADCKATEGPATELNKALKKAWGAPTTTTPSGQDSEYQKLCKWIANICALASNPATANQPVDYLQSCPGIYYTYSVGGGGGEHRTVSYHFHGDAWEVGCKGDDWQVLTVDVNRPTVLLTYPKDADQHYLVLVGLDASGSNSTMQVLTMNNDGTVASTAPAVTWAGRKITAGCMTEGTTGLLCDSEAGTVIHFVDSNGDGAPDSLGSTFASASSFGILPDEFGYVNQDEPGVVVVSAFPVWITTSLPWETDMVVLTDSNLDGSADTAVPKKLIELGTYGRPTIGPIPEDGDLQAGVVANINSTVQVWRTDANGVQLELLGTAITPSLSNSTVVTLSHPVEEGQFVIAKDVTNDLVSTVHEVLPDGSGGTAAGGNVMHVERSILRTGNSPASRRFMIRGTVQLDQPLDASSVMAAETHFVVTSGDNTLAIDIPAGGALWALRGDRLTWHGEETKLMINVRTGEFSVSQRRLAQMTSLTNPVGVVIQFAGLDSANVSIWRTNGPKQLKHGAR